MNVSKGTELLCLWGCRSFSSTSFFALW